MMAGDADVETSSVWKSGLVCESVKNLNSQMGSLHVLGRA